MEVLARYPPPLMFPRLLRAFKISAAVLAAAPETQTCESQGSNGEGIGGRRRSTAEARTVMGRATATSRAVVVVCGGKGESRGEGGGG